VLRKTGEIIKNSLDNTFNKGNILNYLLLPFCKLVQSSSSHILMTDLGPLLMSYDHYAVEFLCEQARLVRHHLHPCLHQQTGLKYKI